MANDYFTPPSFVRFARATAADMNSLSNTVEASFDKLPIEADLKRQRVTYIAGVEASTDVFTAAATYPWTAYQAGATIFVKMPAANTGPATLNVSSLGAKTIRAHDGSALSSGEWTSGAIMGFVYHDGDAGFRLYPMTPGSLGALLRVNNLSDLDNVTTAKTNLGLGAVATSNDYDDLDNLPTLTDVAASGDYDDLTNKRVALTVWYPDILADAMVDDDAVLIFVASEALTFPDDFSGSRLFAFTAATAETVLTVKKNDSAIGTITVAAAGTSGTFATTGTTVALAAGDRLQIEGPATADDSLAGVAITLYGTRD